MSAKREYSDREPTDVAILDALVHRVEDGMTVFELRAAVQADIDELESSLETLKADGLIVVECEGSKTVIRPHERVLPNDDNPDPEQSLGEWIRERVPF